MEHKNIESLIQKARAGDKAAGAALCEAKARDVLYVCIKLTGSYEYGQDAAQEVLIYMYEHLVKLRDPARFNVWLNRIISSSCAQLMRRERRHMNTEILMEAEDDHVDEYAEFLPTEWVESRELRQMVLACLAQLSPRYQQVLLMHYYEGLRVAEIADVLQISQGSVKRTMFRARGALKARIEQDSGKQAAPSDKTAGGLPVLSVILRGEAQALVGEEGAKALLLSAGILGGGGAGAALGAALPAVLGTLAPVLTGVLVFFAGLFSVSSPSSSLSEQGGPSVPQHSAVALAPEDDGVLYIDDAASGPRAESSTVRPGGGASSSKTEEIKSEFDVGGEGELVHVSQSGTLQLVDASGASVPGHSETLALARLDVYRDGVLYESVRPTASGGFVLGFSNDAVYTLRVRLPFEYSLIGEREITLSPGGQLTLRVRNAQPPSLYIGCVDAGGLPAGQVNPTALVLEVGGGAEGYSASWSIYELGGTVPILSGQGLYAEVSGLPQSERRYTAVFTLHDSAGNSIAQERVFYRRQT